MKRSAKLTWLLTNLGVGDAVIVDLVEQHESGRTNGWLWRQVLTATLHVAKANAVLTVGAVVLGWTALWVFFRFVGSPLSRFDQYLLENGLIDRYSAAWCLRSI